MNNISKFNLQNTSYLICLLLLSACGTNDKPAEIISSSPIITQNVDVESKELQGNVMQDNDIKQVNYHVVKDGDTVDSIALQYDITKAMIFKLNHLKSDDDIYIGQRLIVIPESQEDESEEEVIEAFENNNDSVLDKQDTLESDIKKSSKTKKSAYVAPISGSVIKKYGKQKDGTFNKGINISAPKGVSVKSIADGVVKYTGSKAQGYGKMVLIKNEDGKVVTYAHLNSILVKENCVVEKGQKIGTVGSTGGVTQPQLHLQIRGADKQPIDPNSLIGSFK